jgi:outer membrane protein assembly factor BamB
MNYEAPDPDDNASVVFTGLLDGRFAAFDGKSGKLLWQYDTGAVIWAPPATFVENGDRYVLVASGGPGAMKVPELKKTIGPNVLTVFVSGEHEHAAK